LGCKLVPEVKVQVKKFDKRASDDSTTIKKYYELDFKYEEVKEGGDPRNKADKLHMWKTDSLGRQANLNCEFMQTQMVNIRLPDALILEPFITVRVYVKQVKQALEAVKQVLPWKSQSEEIGDHRRSLAPSFPCCWYKGDPKEDDTELTPDGKINPRGDYEKLESTIYQIRIGRRSGKEGIQRGNA